MTAEYLVLTEPLSQESRSGHYKRKALVLSVLLCGFAGVALWSQLAGEEQSFSTVDMFTQPVKALQTMRMPWQSMQSQRMPVAQAFLQPVRAEEKAKAKPKPTAPPFSAKSWEEELKTQLQNPEKTMVKFGGGSGGLLKKGLEEEAYIMTWANPGKEQFFEMPTGGTAIMNAGQNMVYLGRKEHGIALGTKFRSKYKIKDYRIFRINPNGEIQFIHPADGVFPEKVNPGRVGVNRVSFRNE